MPEVILPCPACGCDRVDTHTPEGYMGLIYIIPNAYVSCDDCDCRGPLCSSDHAAIAAWNALPRMSTIIAWQFQASGAALALQRLMDAAQAMRDEQRYWGNLIGTSTDMLITPAINQAACILGNAEDELDGLLDKYRKTLNFVK